MSKLDVSDNLNLLKTHSSATPPRITSLRLDWLKTLVGYQWCHWQQGSRGRQFLCQKWVSDEIYAPTALCAPFRMIRAGKGVFACPGYVALC
jgi:hypothetical protein